MEDSGASAASDALLRGAVDALYAVDPAGFVAARKEWVAKARSVGEREVAKEIGALRKPGVAAAAMNALVRAGDPVVERLRGLGERMRHAQSTLDAPALAALRTERDATLTAWVEAAREHAPGGTLAASIEAEVRDTAIAALADAAAAQVATSGSLTRALSYSGFGEVDIAEAAATTSTGVVLTVIAGEGEEEPVAESEEKAAPQEDEVGEADQEPEGAEPDVDLDALAMDLDEAEKVVAAARATRKAAAEADAAAEQAMTVAQEQVAQAERLLAGAKKSLAQATADRERTAHVLAEREEELAQSREQRDEARAALEEAEDG